ncbi:uncharacterized protein [Zea mays]|uniref:uncharacterized protein n=1 Tax=Zea mays TaxID=4577 RepID=UPI0009A98D01|nr:uncharacterized protein LOC103631169 [Zea mays]|eukprot:XP_020395446.1 uncharacterized protein LOC103631169 [Zea mays]
MCSFCKWVIYEEDVNTDQACEVVSFPDGCSTIDFTNLSTQDIAGGDEQVNLDAYDDSDWLHRNETFQANNIVSSKDLLTPGWVIHASLLELGVLLPDATISCACGMNAPS